MTYPDVTLLVQRAKTRLDEKEEGPIHSFDWLYNEIGTLARARNDIPLTKTTVILFVSSHFYEGIKDDRLEEEYITQVDEGDVLSTPDEEILFSVLIDQDLRELFEDNTLDRGSFNKLIKQIIMEEDLQINNKRYASLATNLSEYLRDAHKLANQEVRTNEAYGIESQFDRLQAEAEAENPNIVDAALDIMMPVHIESQGFPIIE